MAHNVVIKRAVAATNVDSYNRTVVYASGDLDNGTIFALTRTNANDLRWTPAIAGGADAIHLWMATAPEVIYQDKTQGGTVDPRDFTNKAGRAFDATLLVPGDIIEMTGEGIENIATKDYLVADIATESPAYAGSFKLKAADAAVAGFTLKKIGASVLHIGDGAIAPTGVATYVFEVVNN